MTATASRCPPADVIAAFAFGELPAANASSVQAHVSECESCLETVGHLAASSRPETLSVAALDADTLDAGLSRRGQIIGGYCLVRELGQGGMGEVWEAEQRTPVRRSVALKLLKAGMDTRQIVARFEAERQALALMQHPGIAQVFDAGITTNGRPYFVMEYVRGERITRYCDQAELGLPARLLLFQQVCDAVQHAHQKGVIHRDIKPSNVLVTEQDGRPLPKVIDFGLAKLTAPDLKDATLTEIGTVLGTPAYASPEQMSLGAIDVDTRSDVYSLGVLLYELLVGVIPFEPKGGQPDALLELRRNIRELDPTRPSARLSMLGSHASEVARLRGTEVGMLRRQLRGDLDWIVMTALEKDRARRYASPGDLARDTQRYLDHEPVLAGSPTPAYRLRKFVRRHRMGTAFASILLSLVIAFAAVSALQVKRISAERDRAASEAAKASSINAFLQDTLGSADPWQTGSDISVRETLKRAAEKIDASFKGQPLVAASVRRTLGKTYMGLGRLDEAEREIRAALDTRRQLLGPENADVAESLADLANLYQARANYDAADETSRESLAMRRKLFGNAHPLVAESLLDRAALLKKKGEFDGAFQAASEALAIRESVFGPDSHEAAGAVEELGLIAASGKAELARGEQLVRRGYEIHRKLFGTDDLRTALSASNLGSISLYEGKNEQAEAFYRTAMEGELRHLGKSHPDTIVDMENLANALARLKRFDESAALMKDVLAQRRAVLGEDNRLVARTSVNIATLLTASGRLDEAQAAFAEALPRFERTYGPEHPDTVHSVYAYGVLRFKQHAYAEAERLFRQALAIQVKLFPDDHTNIADTRVDLGKTLTELRRFDEAASLLTRAHEAFLKAYGADAADTREASTALDNLQRLRGK
jgi:eukaryotic-like serine/threonine-protein kinase